MSRVLVSESMVRGERWEGLGLRSCLGLRIYLEGRGTWQAGNKSS